MTIQITHKAFQERMAKGVPPGQVDEPTVRRLWWAALDTLQYDILMPMEPSRGLWLASPLPALYEPKLLDCLSGWVWAPEELERLNALQGGLLPPSQANSFKNQKGLEVPSYRRLPLRKEDGNDPLLLILTPQVQVALALRGKDGCRHLLMRSDPETLSDLLKLLDLRLDTEDAEQAMELRQELAELGHLSINQGLDNLFWPRLSERLARMASSITFQSHFEKVVPARTINDKEISMELSLLEALSHEIRTPLATIRTLIRSLLRRKGLSGLVTGRLQQIDDVCTEQIDRFGLIFNAAALQRDNSSQAMLVRTDLGNMLKILFPGWSQQLERRGILLSLDITPELPPVLSNPERLEPMLGGLIDRASRGLSEGGKLSLQLRAAGSRLKLQIICKASNPQEQASVGNELKSELGPVLSWNPNTGSMQLSQEATQKLLASLGGVANPPS